MTATPPGPPHIAECRACGWRSGPHASDAAALLAYGQHLTVGDGRC